RDGSVWKGQGTRLGENASETRVPWSLGRSRWTATDQREHAHPLAGRASARGAGSETGAVVDVSARPSRGRGYRALVVDVLPPFRYRAHFPVSQTAPGMDTGTYSQSRSSGSVDGCDRDRLHAAQARSSTGKGLPTAVAEAATSRETHPGPGACRLSPHPPDTDPSGMCAVRALATGEFLQPKEASIFARIGRRNPAYCMAAVEIRK